MTVIEDGVATYSQKSFHRSNIWYRLAFGPLAKTNYFGHHKQVNKIILTGILPYGNTFRNTIQYINMAELWRQNHNKDAIKSIFNLTNIDLDLLKQYTEIVFTQPLSEDKLMTEKEKIDLYRKLLKNASYDKIIFRPHPREETDYTKYFCGCFVYKKKIPFELLLLSGVKFNKAYTIFSTIVYSLPEQTEIIFGGTSMHPNLVNKFGCIEYDRRRSGPQLHV